MEKGKYYLSKLKEHNYQPEFQKCIEDACQYCINMTFSQSDNDLNDKEKHPIMLLGKIQSGKTRAYTGLMALAFDNQFDMVFILTKNSKALVQQTYKRMRREFNDFIRENEIDVFDIMKVLNGLTDYELNKKIVIVAKKEKSNLDRISDFISDYTIQQRKNCLIIDDEADTTGIGFNKVKGSDDEFDLRTIASKVNKIRGSLDGCVFVQVTATPYALYLQPDFDEENLAPIKPKRTISLPSGEGYVGGEYYFLDSKDDAHPARYIFEPVLEKENELVSDQKRKGKKSKIDDRRIFKEEEIITSRDKLVAFKRGLMNFVVGGCILRRNNPNSHYAFIVHTATQKTSHVKLENITHEFFKQIKSRDSRTSSIINEMLQAAFIDTQKSVEAYGYPMPGYKDVENAFYNAIDKDYISVTVVNSDKDMDAVLDEDNGELRLRSPFSIFVGGQVLDRGVTIPNLIGFYYGRNPKTMQQDTVMQHSRMFGYRNEDLLSVTRFYTTQRIYENMIRITEIDLALREDIESGKFTEGFYFIQKYVSHKKDENGEKVKDEIIPCSPDKIRISNILLLKPNSRLLPVGFTPIAKSYARKISSEIRRHLAEIIDEQERDAVDVSLDVLEPIIKLAYSALKQDEQALRFVSLERLLTTIRYLADNENKVHLIVRRNRKIAKYKGNGVTYQDAPDNGREELAIARKVAIDKPALMLLHQDGTAEGWNESEFWWPVLFSQKNTRRTVFAMPDAGGRLKVK
ncbi:Z1 domain protein [Desulfosporosinus acididurans]|uniref:Z1 domain protein n=1 Tax=Desulfosporosinus acididurans TaxID=476652 RepID=A0A0J1FMW8_9FIRM|nr:Z1 domain-containing protein [Desulfosporosinus acididurans]KLU64849.1 Z1 domain protein [Desulfosporosinus acididurans]